MLSWIEPIIRTWIHIFLGIGAAFIMLMAVSWSSDIYYEWKSSKK